MMSLREAAMALGTVASANAASRFQQVSTDSRTLLPGSLFVALKGPNHDGHDHLAVVAAAGAAGAIVDHRCSVDLPQLVVADTRRALGVVAAYWRQRLPLQLVGVTGSNGKTTVKEMIAAILRQLGSTLATEGNLNNDIGVPLTLLKARPFHQYAVIEMGMSAAGELTWLSSITRPDVAVITNAGPAHLQQFRDVNEIARAKGEILSSLSSKGTAVINGDDPAADFWRSLAEPRKIIDFALDNPAAAIRGHWSATRSGGLLKVEGVAGEWQTELSLLGRANGINALAAVAVAHLLGATPEQCQQGLASLQPVSGRLQLINLSAGGQLINDCYNANPASLGNAIEVLAQMPGRKTLVLGDMGELGEKSEDFHREAGSVAAAAGIDRLFTIGNQSRLAADAFASLRPCGAHHYSDINQCCADLPGFDSNDYLLVKGSRSAGLERLVEFLVERVDGDLPEVLH